MQPCPELIDIVLQNYKHEGFAGGPQEVARRFYSEQTGVIIVGTDPHEWFEDQEAIARFFESSGSNLEIQVDVLEAFCEGTVGWTVDRVRLRLPNGVDLPIRHTRIFHKEDGAWKVIHLHVSIPVPNERIGEF
jgi:hypothetical protein